MAAMKPIRLLIFLIISTAMLLGADQDKPETVLTITLASYAGSDGNLPENHLFIYGQTAYRSIAELRTLFSVFSKSPNYRFAMNGTCDATDPHLTSAEIKELEEAAKAAGVKFTFYPGG